MTVSGTNAFNLDISEIIQEAIDRIGGEPTLGFEPASARRSLNLTLIDLQNRGINLWSLTQASIPMVQGTATYLLPSTTVDVLDVMLSRSGNDTNMVRFSREEYFNLPNKLAQGRPVQFFMDRQRDAPAMTVWMTPENSTDVVKYWYVRQLYDVNSSYSQNIDAPIRFLPAIISGLAYHLAFKRPSLDTNFRQELKARFAEDLAFAQAEDCDRASTFLYIKGGGHNYTY